MRTNYVVKSNIPLLKNKNFINMKKLILMTLVFAGLMCQAQQKKEKETVVVIETSMGTIKAKLYNDTPLHRDNFIKLVNEGWYNGSPFHRVIKDFMIQGGQNADGRMDPGYTVPAEFRDNHFHKKGALCAARQGDQVNPKKASSGSQFYIVQGQVFDDKKLEMYEERLGKIFSATQRQAYKTVGGTPHLDGDYTVFGEVTEGLDIVDKIARVKTGYMDVPVEPVTITKITIEKSDDKGCCH
jgi:peptidyl-prolyl cis-trans isomerase B (cyclophilin B)